MKDIQVSIIMPIYNAQEYLEKSIDSVLMQTFTDFELVLVDDGSKDDSLSLCQELAKKDSRIKVIHQENKGASSAKNLGVLNALGKYIAFLDADDYIDDRYIENLFIGVKEYGADVCIGAVAFVTIDNNEQIVSKKLVEIEQGFFTLEDFMSYYPRYMPQAIIGAPWNKLYLKEIILENGICFNTNIKNNEDTHFNYEYLEKCKTVFVSNKPYYNYINRVGVLSASRGYIPNIFDIYLLTYKKAVDFLKRTNTYEKHIGFQKKYFIGLVIGAINGIVMTDKLVKKEKLKQIKAICDNIEVCNAVRSETGASFKRKVITNLIKRKNKRLLFWLFAIKK